MNPAMDAATTLTRERRQLLADLAALRAEVERLKVGHNQIDKAEYERDVFQNDISSVVTERDQARSELAALRCDIEQVDQARQHALGLAVHYKLALLRCREAVRLSRANCAEVVRWEVNEALKGEGVT